jgi:hypothetical protein
VLDCVGAECRGRYCRGGDSVSVGLGAAALVFALVQGLHSSGVHYLFIWFSFIITSTHTVR